MHKHLLVGGLVAVGIMVIVAGLGLWRGTAAEEIRTFAIHQDPDQSSSARPAISISSGDLAIFPNKAQDAWHEAARAGSASIVLSRSDAQVYMDALGYLAERDRFPAGHWRFSYNGSYFAHAEQV